MADDVKHKTRLSDSPASSILLYYIYIYIYDISLYIYNIYILVAPCFKNILRLEAGYPALRCHNLNQSTGHTHTTHTTKEEEHPSDLK